jgi:AraC-like DNA-binding protein/quercetin dioxygenase-like cupin family protein
MPLATMDALSDILKTIELSANTYFCRGFGSHWNMQIRHRPQGLFHVVTAGQCYLREESTGALMLLTVGDIVAFPTGGGHWISDCSDSQDLAVENVIKVREDSELFLLKSGDVVAYPAGGAHWKNLSQNSKNIENNWPTQDLSASDNAFDEHEKSNSSDQVTTLLSVTFSYDTTVNHPFLKDLPCFIRIGTDEGCEFHWLRNLISVLENESKTSSPGSSAMVDRLTEMLFIQLLRAHMQQMTHPSGYMAALLDPKIGLALNLIHSETNGQWTVESLSKAAALSRTLFTEKFTSLVGSTPKSYLTDTRMLKAKGKLQYSGDSILSIAESIGYASESSFSKALKQHFKMTPGQIRKASQM